MSNANNTQAKAEPAQKNIQQKAEAKPGAQKKLSSDAIKKLELEYFKRRRELEREERKARQVALSKDIAESKKLVQKLRKHYAMTDEQIVKRFGLKLIA